MKKIELPEGYHPSEDEPYMNAKQVEYFRRRLLEWREQLGNEATGGVNILRNANDDEVEGDIADKGRLAADQALELRTHSRCIKLIRKIDEALNRIRQGTYGFCEETGDKIGIRRLEARPIATLSLESQIRHERRERLVKG
ncbi:MAG: TraR/DksA C4-type zinc finger protein [Desulfatiglandales bacterium]